MAFQGDDIDRLLDEDSGRSGGRSERRKRRRSGSRSRSRGRGGGRNMEDVMSRRYQRQAEKHKRTVFAANVHPKVEEYEVFEFFSEAGKVVDIQLLRDPRSFRSKGLCYIEFDDSKDVPIALSLSGRQLGGFPIVVQLTQAEKNIAAQIAQDMANSQRSIKVKVKNLAKEMREEDLHPVFAAFGDVTEIYLRRASDGQTREGFVEFVKSSEGVAAMQQLNGLEILGLKMQVYTDKPIDYTGMLDPTALAQNIAGGASVPEIADGPSLAEDSGNGGLLLSNSARMGLMAKLSKGAFPDMPQPGQPVPGIAAPQATVTPCLLLKNMFNPSAEGLNMFLSRRQGVTVAWGAAIPGTGCPGCGISGKAPLDSLAMSPIRAEFESRSPPFPESSAKLGPSAISGTEAPPAIFWARAVGSS